MTKLFKIARTFASAGVLLSLLAAPALAQSTGLDKFIGAEPPPSFDAPAGAVDAFKAALASDDLGGLAKLLGLDGDKLKGADGVADTFNQMKEAAAKQVTVEDEGDQQIIDLGKQLWPVPFPIVKAEDGKWAFDTAAGISEIIDRRVGENEDQTGKTLSALVDAQNDYMSEDRDGDGVLEFAQKLISTPGKTDGLYWPASQGDGDSPAGPLASNEQQVAKVKNDEGYFGYRYRILTGQGDRVVGGAYDYIVNGNMISGFALIAWPVKYGETGVHTFLVNKDGVVYQQDLGDNTEAIAKSIKRFNPGSNWELVND